MGATFRMHHCWMGSKMMGYFEQSPLTLAVNAAAR